MNFQVYTSTCGPKARSYIVPDDQLWDNQVLVFESNSMDKIAKYFQRKIYIPWERNTLFYPRDKIGLDSYENGGLRYIASRITI